MRLALGGELDLAGVETFRAHLRIAADKSNIIVLDFSGLRYIDSSGINALLSAHKAFSYGKGQLALIGVSRAIRRILGVLEVERLIPVFPNEDEALEYFRSNKA